MQVETDFLHSMKLNCSSIASSTPQNNASFPEGELIKFEEFTVKEQDQKYHDNFGHKKRLTIQINDSYDFNPSSLSNSQLAVGVQSATTETQDNKLSFFKKNQKHQDSHYCLGESQSPSFSNSNSEVQITKILSYNALLQEKFNQLQLQNVSLRSILTQQKSEVKTLKAQNETFRLHLKKKEQALHCQKERSNRLSEKIAQLQEQKSEQNFYDEKLRDKQTKIQQLQRKLDKMTNINKTFQKQLKQSEKKIMELQKQAQKAFCQNQQQAISRIKESSVKVKEIPAKSKELIANKQNQNYNAANYLGNTLGSTMQMRKSVDKKKFSQSQGKKKQPIQKTSETAIRGQRASSSSIVAKKLLNLKKQ